MKQKSEGIGLVVGRVQRIEEEAANAKREEVLKAAEQLGWP